MCKDIVMLVYTSKNKFRSWSRTIQAISFQENIDVCVKYVVIVPGMLCWFGEFSGKEEDEALWHSME